MEYNTFEADVNGKDDLGNNTALIYGCSGLTANDGKSLIVVIHHTSENKFVVDFIDEDYKSNEKVNELILTAEEKLTAKQEMQAVLEPQYMIEAI